MSGGFGEEMFTDMLDQEYAKLSIANQSMGLADTIADQLDEIVRRSIEQWRQTR